MDPYLPKGGTADAHPPRVVSKENTQIKLFRKVRNLNLFEGIYLEMYSYFGDSVGTPMFMMAIL